MVYIYRGHLLLFRQDLLCVIFSHDQNSTQKAICLVNKYQSSSYYTLKVVYLKH